MEGNIQEGYKIMSGIMVEGGQVLKSKDHLTSSSYAGSYADLLQQQATHW